MSELVALSMAVAASTLALNFAWRRWRGVRQTSTPAADDPPADAGNVSALPMREAAESTPDPESGDPEDAMASEATGTQEAPGTQEHTGTPEHAGTHSLGSDPADDLAWMADLTRSLEPRVDVPTAADVVTRTAARLADARGALLRLYSPRTRLFEARSFFEVSDPLVSEVSHRDVTERDFSGMLRVARPVGQAYLVRAVPAGADGENARRSGRGEESRDRPAADDAMPVFPDQALASNGSLLVVPLPGSDGKPFGYLALAVGPDTPFAGYTGDSGGHDGESSGRDGESGGRDGESGGRDGDRVHRVLSRLSVLVRLAVSALESARLRGRLEHRQLELSLAQEKLKDVTRLKENFIGAVSHELRTPLTSVKAYAEMLSRSLDTMKPPTVREFVEVIQRESDRLTAVFDDILDVDHLEKGRARLLSADFSLRELCHGAVEKAADAFCAKGVSLRFLAPTHEVSLHGDRVALAQVVQHLLDNARKFTPAGGQVELEVHEGVSTVQIAVEDTGVGVPEEERERIFDRFHQVDSSNTRSFGGQGLGLCICREIVQWHRGRIWVETSLTGGSRFVVRLPRKGLVMSSAGSRDADPDERVHREAFLHLVTSMLSETMGARIVSLMLLDESRDALYVEAAVGLDEQAVESVRQRRGEGIAGRVWEQGCSLLVPDLDADPLFAGKSNTLAYSGRSLLSSPLIEDGGVIGVLNVNNKVDGQPFDDDDRLLLEAIAERVTRALAHYDAFRDGRNRLVATNDALRAIVDVGRARRTALREGLACCGIEAARRLGLDEHDLRTLAFVLRTYDLGLAHVDPEVLLKGAPLTVEERERIESHVGAGVELATGVETSPRVLKILVHHHENVDGSGYPEGLKGEAIPMGARIVRLVDVLSALLHDQPTRSALAWDDSLREVRAQVGHLFCPRATPVFLAVVDERRGTLNDERPRREVELFHQASVERHLPLTVVAGSKENP